MAYFWEKDFWTGKEGETDIWDIKTLGLTELTDSDNPLDMAGNIWNYATGQTSADRAADRQRKALGEATAAQERMFEKSLETQKPWLQAGERALGRLESGLESGEFEVSRQQYQPGEYQEPSEYKEMTFDFEADPGYQFRLKSGQDILESSAAAKGGFFSGGLGKALTDYGQGSASQEYANAYNRFADQRNFGRGAYESDRSFGRGTFESDRRFGYGMFADDFNRQRALKADQYNKIASLAGLGQVSAGNIGSQEIAQGSNLANLELQRGNIGAQQAMAGYQGTMNLINTGLQGLSAYMGAK